MIDQPKCPFYGFIGMYGAFIQMGGTENACAGLTKSGTHRCYMEESGKKPDWNKCPSNSMETKRNLEKYLSLNVFLRDKTKMTVKEWIAKILGKDDFLLIPQSEEDIEEVLRRTPERLKRHLN